jgi:hypothetical protein
MFRMRRFIGLLLVLAVASLGAGELRAAICGFPLIVGAGAAVAPIGTGWVLLFFPFPPFAAGGIGAVPLDTAFGLACEELWVDSTLGPAPPNFNAVWGPAPPNPASCALPGCGPFAVCGFPPPAGATFCEAFP